VIDPALKQAVKGAPCGLVGLDTGFGQPKWFTQRVFTVNTFQYRLDKGLLDLRTSGP